jgi:hypothetical protein
MFVHKFSWENNILYGMYKKDKKYSVCSRVGAAKLVFFTQDTKNVLFLGKLMHEHKMSRCTCAILFHNFFYILQCVFTQWVHMHLWAEMNIRLIRSYIWFNYPHDMKTLSCCWHSNSPTYIKISMCPKITLTCFPCRAMY